MLTPRRYAPCQALCSAFLLRSSSHWTNINARFLGTHLSARYATIRRSTGYSERNLAPSAIAWRPRLARGVLEVQGRGGRPSQALKPKTRRRSSRRGLAHHFVARVSSRTKSAPRAHCLCEANVFRPPKLQHAVQQRDSNGHLGRLPPFGPRAQRVTDHALVAADIGLHQGTPIVARCPLPAHAAALGDQLQVPVALGRRGLCRSAWHRARTRAEIIGRSTDVFRRDREFDVSALTSRSISLSSSRV